MNRIGEKDKDKIKAKMKSVEFKEIFLVIREGKEEYIYFKLFFLKASLCFITQF